MVIMPWLADAKGGNRLVVMQLGQVVLEEFASEKALALGLRHHHFADRPRREQLLPKPQD